MKHKTWDSFIDKHYPPGSDKRKDLDEYLRKARIKDERLDHIFGWMKRIPPRLPPDLDEWGWDHAYWKGLGPLMYLFWRTLADEGFYGALDMMSFHYFQDRYILKFSDIRKNRSEARAYRALKKK